MIERRGLYLYRNGDVVGKLRNPYCIAVRDKRHYFRKYDGFALAVESCEWLLYHKFTFFQVIYKPDNKVFTYRVSDFPTGKRIDYPPHGEQYVLSKTKSLVIPKTSNLDR
ncbi:MAG: hypothetical protein AAE983_03060 [Thermoplasmataceae archaeon]